MKANLRKILSRISHLFAEAIALETCSPENVIWELSREGTNQITLHVRFDADPSIIDSLIRGLIVDGQPDRMNRIAYTDSYDKELENLKMVANAPDIAEECAGCQQIIEALEWRYPIGPTGAVYCQDCYTKQLEKEYHPQSFDQDHDEEEEEN